MGAVRGVKGWRPNRLPRIDELYLGPFPGVRRHIQYYLLRKKQRGPHYTWELYIVELLHSQREFVDPLSRAFRNALAQLNFLPAWQVIYPTIQEATEIE